MYSNQYLVSVYHRKKHILVQQLTTGDMTDAEKLVMAVCWAYFGDKAKHLVATVAEITLGNVTVYKAPEEISVTAKRNLDKDLYLCQVYESDILRCICTDNESRVKQKIDEMLKNKNKPAPHYVLNKINFREIGRVDGNEHTRINFTSYPNCYREDFMEEAEKVKL